MTEPVSLPLWLVALLAALSLASVLRFFLLPAVRWFIRRRVERVLSEVNRRLSVRIQPFKLTKRRVLIDRLRYDPQVMAAVEAASLEQGTPRDVLMARVKRDAREIVPAFNAYFYFRVGAFLARAAARALYRVRLGYTDEEGLSRIPPDSTIVFVMNHRSNMDYILVSYLAAERTALSYAVGEWARIWPLQTLIRATGAYFVRRNSRDPLYRRVLERYVQMATENGVTQAVFPEGGLSRDGRLRPPRLGILDYLLKAFDPKGPRDLVFLPVGINYDRVLEDRTLLLDLDPKAERPGALGAAARTLRFVLQNLALMLQSEWRRFGYACVNGGTPVSARAWLAARGVDPRTLPKEERLALVQRFAGELMGGIARVVPVLPVPLVAAVLVENAGRPLSELDVKALVSQKVRELEGTGRKVYVPRGDLDYALSVGLRMLKTRRLVTESYGLISARPEEMTLLRYYAGSIEPPAAVESAP